jgi:hypothetical protein
MKPTKQSIASLINTTQKYFILPLCGCVLLLVGCSGPDAVDAIPRSSTKKPVVVKHVTSSSDSQFPFLQADHFLCLAVEVEPILNNEQLSDIDWDDLSTQLASVVGKSNADLNKISRISLLIDKEDVSMAAMMAPRSRNFPFLFVFDYDQAVLKEDLEARNKTIVDSRKGKSRRNLPPLLLAKALGDNRITFGKDSLLDKLTESTRPVPLASKVDALIGNDEIVGVFEFDPIRDEIRAAFGMLTQIPGMGFESYAQLPDVADRIDLQFSLKNETLMAANFYIDDESLLETFSVSITEAMSASSSNLDSSFDSSIDMDLMFEPSLTGVMPKIIEQILDDQLLDVKTDSQKLMLKLKRPRDTDDFIKAVVKDSTHQIYLSQRMAAMTKIADAMKAYQKKYDRLPAMTATDESGKNKLSWRVELLPFMDQQELYDQFKHDEAWDSEANLAAAKNIPVEFSIGNDSTDSRLNLATGELGAMDDETIADPAPEFLFLIVEGGPESPWAKPDVAVDLNSNSLEQMGVDDENGVLLIKENFEVKTVLKDQPTRYLELPTGR